MKQSPKNMVKCPACGKVVPYQGNPYRPFCSQRCKMADLEGWFSEHYRISTPVTSEVVGLEPSERDAGNQS